MLDVCDRDINDHGGGWDDQMLLLLGFAWGLGV